MDEETNTVDESSIVPVNQDALADKPLEDNPEDLAQPADLPVLSDDSDLESTPPSSATQSEENRENTQTTDQNSGESNGQSEESVGATAIVPVDPEALAETEKEEENASTADAEAADGDTSRTPKSRGSRTRRKSSHSREPKQLTNDGTPVSFEGVEDEALRQQLPFEPFNTDLQAAIQSGDIVLPVLPVANEEPIIETPDVDSVSSLDYLDTSDNMDPEGVEYVAWTHNDNEGDLAQSIMTSRDNTIPDKRGSFKQISVPMQSVTPWFLDPIESVEPKQLINLNLFEV